MGLRRGMMAGGGGGGVDATALSIYNKLAQGDWFTCESATSPLTGARNSTSAAKIGTGATSSVAGKVGSAIDVTPSAVYRATALPYTPTTGSTYAAGIWVNADSLATVCPLVIAQGTNQDGDDRALQIFLMSTGALKVRAGKVGTATFTDADTSASSVATGGWYFLQAERGADYVRGRVNAGAWVSVALTSNAAPTTDQCVTLAGAYNSSSSTYQNGFDGLFDESFFIHGTLTDAEWDYLYNSGAGLSYAALKSAAGF